MAFCNHLDLKNIHPKLPKPTERKTTINHFSKLNRKLPLTTEHLTCTRFTIIKELSWHLHKNQIAKVVYNLEKRLTTTGIYKNKSQCHERNLTIHCYPIR